MRHQTHRTFSFHAMNKHLRDLGDGMGRAFVRRLSGGKGFDPQTIAKVLHDREKEGASLVRSLLSFSSSLRVDPDDGGSSCTLSRKLAASFAFASLP